MRAAHRAGALVAAAGAAFMVCVIGASPASAHPLGNFTVNHFAALTVSRTSIAVDAIVDSAEIPTAQARGQWDPDGSGASSPAESAQYAASRCQEVAGQLGLTVNGASEQARVLATTVAFPVGAAGLPTTRLECRLAYALDLNSRAAVTFADNGDAGRLGWREVVATGDRTTLSGSQVPTTSVSRALTAYPQDLLTSPLDVRRASFRVTAGGAAARTQVAGPANALLPQQVDRLSQAFTGLVGHGGSSAPAVGLALLLAVLLGAGHALLPGHGKTIMAAYIVGRRGTVGDAVVVGATVTATHTVGVLVLGVLVSVSTAVAPEQVVHYLSLASGVIVAGVGAFLLAGVLRRGAARPVPETFAELVAAGAERRGGAPAALPEHGHGHGHEDGDAHGHEPDNGHEHPHGHPHPHGHEHPHGRAHGHDHGPDARFGRRGLLGIGVAGGLVPSPSALLVLLAAFGLGRPVYGIVLVLCYGIGMSLALTFAGLTLVRLRARWEGLLRSRGYDRVSRWSLALPAVTAAVVLLTGLWLAFRAVATLV